MKLTVLLAALLLSACATMQPGIDAMNRGDLDAAERNFTEALQRGDTMAWNNLGVVYQRRGDTEKAIAHYTMAARWGHQLAQQNLVAMGAPVPAADLANARAQRNAADSANTLMLMQALQPRPAPFIQPDVHCTSQRWGNTVQTRCN